MEAYREEARRLLDEIFRLVEERRKVVREIWKEKRRRGLPIEDPKREMELRPKLDRNLGMLFNLLLWDSLSLQGFRPLPVAGERAVQVDLSREDPDIFFPDKIDLTSRVDLEEAISDRFGLHVRRAYVLPDRYTALLLAFWSECRGFQVSFPRPSPLIYGLMAWMAGARPYFGFDVGCKVAGVPHNPSGSYNAEIADCTYFDFSPRKASARIFIYSPGAILGIMSPSIVFGEIGEELASLLVHFENRGDRRIAEALLSIEKPEWEGLSGEILDSVKEIGLSPIDYNGGPFLLLKIKGGHRRLLKAGVSTAPGRLFNLPDDYVRMTIASKEVFEALELIRHAFS